MQTRPIAAIRRSADTQTAPIGVPWAGGIMTAPVTASERDPQHPGGDHRGSPRRPLSGVRAAVAAGHTNIQIARRLGLSEGTVRTHLENIYGRLHVSSRTAAVNRAFPDQTAV